MNQNQSQMRGCVTLGIALGIAAAYGDDENLRGVDSCNRSLYGTKGGHRGPLSPYVERTEELSPEDIFLAREAQADMIEELDEFGEVMGLDPDELDALKDIADATSVDQFTFGPDITMMRESRNREFPRRSSGRFAGTRRGLVVEASALGVKPCSTRRPAPVPMPAPVARQTVTATPPQQRQQTPSPRYGTHGKAHPRFNGGVAGAFGSKK